MFILQPWQFFVVILVGWVQREQQKIIEFYQLQVEALLKAQGKKRLLLTDDQRRLLAVNAKALGRKALMERTTIVTPDTILRWHRQLVAQKWDYSNRRKSVGRPRMEKEIVDLVLRFARENPTWGFDRIRDALANLGHSISDQTVGNILKEHGLEPAGAGCTTNPGEPWMKQIGRNLTDAEDGFLNGKRYILMDRDGKFSPAFNAILANEGVNPVPLPPKSPNLNAQLERFHRSLKDECLSRMVFFGEKMLRTAVGQFLEHYHGERNHQGLDNKIIEPGDEVGREDGEIKCRERLGGLLRYYYRDAA